MKTDAVLDPMNPAPGVYQGVPMETYLALPLISASGLEEFHRSPFHFRHRKPLPETDALRLGSAVHTFVLEPALFSKLYSVSQACCQPLSSGARKGEPCGSPGRASLSSDPAYWLCGTHMRGKEADLDAGRTIVTAPEFAGIESMAASIDGHARARSLFMGDGMFEATVIFEDPDTGHLCKIRPDRLVERAGMVTDLKTTRDASPHAFGRQAASLGYHRKMAFYLRGLRAAGLNVPNASIVAVENVSPHAAQPYLYSPEDMARAEMDIVRLMGRLKACEESGEWPSYAGEFLTLSVPDYAFEEGVEEVWEDDMEEGPADG